MQPLPALVASCILLAGCFGETADPAPTCGTWTFAVDFQGAAGKARIVLWG